MDALNEIRKKHIDPNIPGKLYHYTSLAALKCIFENKWIWVSNIKTLNDSTESKKFTERFNSKLENWKYKNERERRIILNLIDTYRNITNKIHDDIYVLSLTSRSDSINMWNYYGFQDGYSICFDGHELMKSLVETFPIVNCKENKPEYKNRVSTYEGKVIYGEEKIDEVINDYCELFIQYSLLYIDDEIEEEKFRDMYIGIQNDLFVFSCISKDISYAEEEEYRILFILPPGEKQDELRKNYIYFRQFHGTLIPYISINIEKIIRSCVCEIKIGPKINIDIAEYGMKKFLDNQNLNTIEINKSEIPMRY